MHNGSLVLVFALSFVLLKTNISEIHKSVFFWSFWAAKQAGIITRGRHFLLNAPPPPTHTPPPFIRFEQPSQDSADISEWAAVQTSGRARSQLSKWQSHILFAVTVTRLTQCELHQSILWTPMEHARSPPSAGPVTHLDLLCSHCKSAASLSRSLFLFLSAYLQIFDRHSHIIMCLYSEWNKAICCHDCMHAYRRCLYLCWPQLAFICSPVPQTLHAYNLE